MKLQLLASTPEPERACAVAARLCYRDATVAELSKDLHQEEIALLLAKVIDNGHLSVLEHASFTFGVEDISRASTHQLVRHRIASFSQQSQRYNRIKQPGFVTPPAIRSNLETSQAFADVLCLAEKCYQQLLAAGITAEDARYILPQATTSRIIFSMNARELWHFFEMRCCQRAQWEIRTLAFLALEAAKKKAPSLFTHAGPTCWHGFCLERDYPCFRKGSLFFQESYKRAIKQLKDCGVEVEEVVLPQFCAEISKISSLLGISRNQCLQPTWVKWQDRLGILLSADIQQWIAQLARQNGNAPILLPEQEVRRQTGFSKVAFPLVLESKPITYWVDPGIWSESVFYLPVGTPWIATKVEADNLRQILGQVNNDGRMQ
jgi:thymidylate synthase (FAD)